MIFKTSVPIKANISRCSTSKECGWCSFVFVILVLYLKMLFFRLARHRKIVEPEVVGESDSEVEGDAWRMEREDSSEEEEEEMDDEV